MHTSFISKMSQFLVPRSIAHSSIGSVFVQYQSVRMLWSSGMVYASFITSIFWVSVNRYIQIMRYLELQWEYYFLHISRKVYREIKPIFSLDGCGDQHWLFRPMGDLHFDRLRCFWWKDSRVRWHGIFQETVSQ